jgi:UDP-N-acetylmuramate--alanine ligase
MPAPSPLRRPRFIMELFRLMVLYQRLKSFLLSAQEVYLVVDTAAQMVHLCRQAEVIESLSASTAALGLGSKEGSNRTPTGIHRIVEKIGDDAPEGRIFRDRRDTGVTWYPGLTEDNLILTRILRLEGLEEGLNRGPGVDSYERYIYLHGTNREDLVGTPLSHGCVCLRNHDIARLYDKVPKSTIVVIDPPSVTINGYSCAHIHFSGILGSGMSAIAQYLRWHGIMITGSDRLLSSPDTAPTASSLAEMGCLLFDQNGSGIRPSTDAVCVSTAIEESNPDITAARERNIPVIHRSDVLAAVVASRHTIAVAGTSGKSTVTAMIFEFLTACGKSPSLISGAPLLRLEQQGYIGNAFHGTSDLLVIEADESDGTLVKYSPADAVILNLSKDHKPVEEVTALFMTFARQAVWTAINADDRGLDRIEAQQRFGTGPSATWKPERIDLAPDGVTVWRQCLAYHLPLPGKHNAENLCAALCVCEHAGCDPKMLSDAARTFQGVARRFNVMKTVKGVFVVDDFAHNPAKIAAAISAGRTLSNRIIAVYQPHGFGPTRFLKNEYIATFKQLLTETDALYLLPIYYAGGTTDKNISSEDIVRDLGEVPFAAEAVGSRDALLARLKDRTQSGDCVLLMGARDPSLASFAKSIADVFHGVVTA